MLIIRYCSVYFVVIFVVSFSFEYDFHHFIFILLWSLCCLVNSIFTHKHTQKNVFRSCSPARIYNSNVAEFGNKFYNFFCICFVKFTSIHIFIVAYKCIFHTRANNHAHAQETGDIQSCLSSSPSYTPLKTSLYDFRWMAVSLFLPLLFSGYI